MTRQMWSVTSLALPNMWFVPSFFLSLFRWYILCSADVSGYHQFLSLLLHESPARMASSNLTSIDWMLQHERVTSFSDDEPPHFNYSWVARLPMTHYLEPSTLFRRSWSQRASIMSFPLTFGDKAQV